MAGGNILFSFGVITDVQYADVPDDWNYHKTRMRYYRKGLTCLKDAITHWNDNNIKFVLQLGDFIDGFSNRTDNRSKDFNSLMSACQKFKGFMIHSYGNHELYNFSRKDLFQTFLYPKIEVQNEAVFKKQNTFYSSQDIINAKLCAYHFSPYKGFRIINIDCYDTSPLGRSPSESQYEKGMKILHENNPNQEKNDPPPSEAKRKYVKYNGGIGQMQLEWLDKVLSYADRTEEKVIIIGHIAILAKSGSHSCLIWNNEEVLRTIYKHSCVVAYFAGHDHECPGYFKDEKGIHHKTFHAVVETIPSSLGGQGTAFATANVFPDKIVLNGYGEEESFVFNF